MYLSCVIVLSTFHFVHPEFWTALSHLQILLKTDPNITIFVYKTVFLWLSNFVIVLLCVIQFCPYSWMWLNKLDSLHQVVRFCLSLVWFQTQLDVEILYVGIDAHHHNISYQAGSMRNASKRYYVIIFWNLCIWTEKPLLVRANAYVMCVIEVKTTICLLLSFPFCF